MRRSIFYLITNLKNGKQYVGQTRRENLAERWREHLRNARTRCASRHYMPITRAIAKYGVEAFRVEQIASAIDDDFGAVEGELIKQYASFAPRGYNVAAGGEGVMAGRRHSAASRAKMSASQKKRELSGENNPFFGKKHSKATLALYSKQRRGRKHSDEWREEQSRRNAGEDNPYFGRKHSAAVRRKMRKAAKTRPPMTQETRLKISAALTRYRAAHG